MCSLKYPQRDCRNGQEKWSPYPVTIVMQSHQTTEAQALTPSLLPGSRRFQKSNPCTVLLNRFTSTPAGRGRMCRGEANVSKGPIRMQSRPWFAMRGASHKESILVERDISKFLAYNCPDQSHCFSALGFSILENIWVFEKRNRLALSCLKEVPAQGIGSPADPLSRARASTVKARDRKEVLDSLAQRSSIANGQK
jgi:hypothetical protein